MIKSFSECGANIPEGNSMNQDIAGSLNVEGLFNLRERRDKQVEKHQRGYQQGEKRIYVIG
jgi:hypothetical protein